MEELQMQMKITQEEFKQLLYKRHEAEASKQEIIEDVHYNHPQLTQEEKQDLVETVMMFDPEELGVEWAMYVAEREEE
jgi:hypothetical protein